MNTKTPLLDRKSEDERQYWMKKLAEPYESSNILLDYERPAEFTADRDVIEFRLRRPVVERLDQVTANSPFLLYTALTAALKLCLYKHSRTALTAVGSPAAKRLDGTYQRPNVVTVLDEVNDDLTFKQLLMNVRGTLVEAYERQDYPFEKLLADVGAEKVENHCALFDVLLALSEIHVAPPEIRNDISLTFSREGPDVRCEVAYRRSLYRRESVRWLVSHFERALEAGINRPEARVGEIELLTDEERELVLKAWGAGPRRPAEGFALVHEMFERHARERPDAVAVESEAGRLSYGELEARSNQLARYLRKRGVGAEVVVGLSVGKSLEMVLGILGVLKAGGAYVPIDAEYPKERKAYMLADSRARLVLSVAGPEADELEAEGIEVVRLDEWGEIGRESGERPAASVGGQNAAYMLYTSGSTGTPKGVVVSHQNLTNLIPELVRMKGLGPGSRVFLFVSISFDPSVMDIFMTLAAGGTLCLRQMDTEHIGAGLTRLLREEAITHATIPPSVLSVLPVEQLPALRTLTTGGEACAPEVLARWARGRRLFNGYGVTEATIQTTVAEFTPDGIRPSIGSVMPNMTVYPLDAGLRPVPVGVPGELYIGGLGLARGYANKPGLTAAHFIPNPFGDRPGERLYKTGDLARHLPDGQLDFLGRADDQVKIRGRRIELREIESALHQCEGVRDAVVLMREDTPGNKRIVAYLVTNGNGAAHGSEDLSASLSRRLPGYMVPAAFVELEELPRTPNGKIDRRALPAPEAARTPSAAPARTPVQEVVAGIWSQILGLGEVGIHDNFFDLGGQSLLATQVIFRVNSVFRVELPVRAAFDAPTVAELSEQIEEARRAVRGIAAPPLVPAPRDRELPLSFAQQRLWFMDQLDPHSAMYNVPSSVRLSGPLDAGALRRSLAEVVRRHEVLRTTFAAVDGRAVQQIGAARPLPLPVVDLSGLPAERREAELQRVATEDARRPFDLRNGPPLRATLLRLGDTDHAVAFTMHHIVSDPWSTAILIREVSALYDAYTSGRPSPLEELPTQYADFAAWQRGWLRGEALEAQLDYWKRQLGGDVPVLRLPADRLPPASPTRRGAISLFTLPAETLQALRELGRQEGVTLFMTLLAAFKALLYRYSGQTDIVVGSPISNRSRLEVESLIGFFVNTLAMRTDLSGRPSFRELLARVREVALGAYAHQDVPFEKLVAELKIGRETNRHALFNVWFALQDAPAPALKLNKLTVSPLPVSLGVAKFDLSLTMWTEADVMVGALQYDTEIFDEPTAAAMTRHFEVLLQALVADPDRTISRAPLLSDEEFRHLVVASNDTAAADIPTLPQLHRLIELQVGRTPDATALVFGDQLLTYRELNERANRLAHYLARRGVGPESRVGVCIERSVEMVVALVAVLKAGAAYVPLDAEYPAERLGFMLADAAVSALLIHGPTRGVVAAEGVEAILMDEQWGEIAAYPATNPAPPLGADNLAYVIYTSGSTGRPKGAMNTQAAICNRLEWMQRRYVLTAGDRVLQKTPLSFDVSVWELFWPLVSGAALVVAAPGGHRDAAYLVEEIRRRGVTVVHFVPSLLGVFLEQEGVAGCESLRQVISSGEALSGETCVRFGERLRGAELDNLYGPTEAAVDVTFWRSDKKAGRVKIGSPIANTQIYILDDELQPTPTGVAGELYIAGAGLARGYLNRPGLTAEKFIPNPFGASGGERMYQTGDLARHLRDGGIEYVGRIDNQIKVRGFRIELGEIETALRAHPSVLDAAVLLKEQAPGQKTLIGYVAAATGADGADAGELREHLRRRLPEYMVPSSVSVLERMPLTPNGKVDRRALAALPVEADGAGGGSREGAAPRTRAEATLARVWAEVLGRESVGVYDNFFELGGDSILGIQMVAKANQAGLRLTARQLFRHQTVADLSAVAGQEPTAEAEQGAVSGPVPLTPIQHWFFEQQVPAPHHFNQSLLFELKTPLGAGLLRESLRRLLEHHDGLRLRFEQTADGWRQTDAPAESNEVFHHVDLSLCRDASRLITEAAAACQASLDLTRGPLVRAVLFTPGGGEPQRLLLIVHHLAVDNVSWRVLLEDLQTAYAQLSRGETVALPPKTTSFKAWAEKLGEYAQSEELRRELAYWSGGAQAAPARLPVDFPGGENSIASTGIISASLGAEETQALLQEVPKAYRTQINDALLTALAQALAGWAGGRTLRVNLEGHGREEFLEGVDVSRTVGWFTTLFPVLLDAGDAHRPGEALKSVKEQLRRVPNRGIGYGLLRYLCGDAEVRERLASAPDAEVSFNYLGQYDNVLPSSSPFGPARESAGLPYDRRTSRAHLLDVAGRVAGGRLHLDIAYGAELHRRETIERLAASFVEALRALIAHCRSEEAGGYTPSDFPLVELGQDSLDRLRARFGAVEDVYPLSPLQQGILFHTLYAPDAGVYVGQLDCRLSGALDATAFRRAWQQTVDRHQILRTAFAWDIHRQPVQIVKPQAALHWAEHDWSDAPPARQEELLESYLKEQRETRLDLSDPPLMRLSLIRLGQDAYHFVWDHHHLLLDGWSVPLLLQEVLGSYRAFQRGAPSNPPRPRPYRDYIDWLGRQDEAEAEAFWRETMAGFDAPTLLSPPPAAAAAQDGDAAAFGEQQGRTSPETMEALQALVRQHHLTLNALLQGVWALLLGRYRGSSDVVFGATSSGRPADLPGIETMLGLFINTLPVRVRMSPDEELLPWLRELHRQQMEARQYEYVSLVQVHEWSRVPKGSPMFDTLLVFENFPVAEAETAPGERATLSVTSVRSFIRNSIPLTVRAIPSSSLIYSIMYDGKLFDAAQVAAMSKHIELLLEEIARRSEVRLGELVRVLDEFDRQESAARERLLKESRLEKLKGIRQRRVGTLQAEG